MQQVLFWGGGEGRGRGVVTAVVLSSDVSGSHPRGHAHNVKALTGINKCVCVCVCVCVCARGVGGDRRRTNTVSQRKWETGSPWTTERGEMEEEGGG